MRLHNSQLRLAREERRTKVAAQILGGMTISEASDALGIPRTTLFNDLKAIKKDWAEQRRKHLDEHMDIINRRYDVMLNAVWERAANGNLQAIFAVIKIENERRRMLGIDSPLKVEDVTPQINRARLDVVIQGLPRELLDAYGVLAESLESDEEPTKPAIPETTDEQEAPAIDVDFRAAS